MNKRFINGLAALAVVFSGAGALPTGTFGGFSLTANAATIVDSGKCGDNLTYTLDSEGTLTISGTGYMDWFSMTGKNDSRPWSAYRDDIVKVVIQSGVMSISDFAFYGFNNISEVTFAETVEYLDRTAFMGTDWLEAQRKENPLVIVNNNLIDGQTAEGNVIIPDSVEIICTGAFSGCKNLTGVTIPNSVREIAARAFSSCRKLTSVVIPNSVKSIADMTFYDCSSLESVTIPDSVTTIWQNVFRDCTNLASITIPASVTSIGDYTFNGCSEGFTIKGCKGTAAETYAKNNGFTFIALDGASAVPGDLNGDGAVDVDDIVLMQKATAGWKVAESVKKAADLDGNGTIDVEELVMVQKKAAGWKIVLG